jgi:hypothetical protein
MVVAESSAVLLPKSYVAEMLGLLEEHAGGPFLPISVREHGRNPQVPRTLLVLLPQLC